MYKKISILRLFLIFSFCLLGLVLLLPNLYSNSSLPSWFASNKIRLGLDLRGGSHLVLKVDFNSYLTEQLNILKDALKRNLKSEKITFQHLSIVSSEIIFSSNEQNKINKVLSKIEDIEFSQKDQQFLIKFSNNKIEQFHKNLLEQSIEIIRRRVDETGTTEPIIQKQGEDSILLQVPGVDDPSSLKNLIGKTAKLGFYLVKDASITKPEQLLPGTMFVENEEGSANKIYYIIDKIPALTGDSLTDAHVSFKDGNEPIVNFAFNKFGAQIFADITSSENRGRALAIVLDNKVISAPRINDPIIGGSGIITGNFTIKSATDLALLLRAGALPAPLEIIEERSVGPGLGEDSIQAGQFAVKVSIIAVMLFMILVYGTFGLIANIALIFNIVFLMGGLSILQATLTLPGIAGIILTVGMSVDTNVLIFERIREEFKKGNGVISSIEKGFKQAYATITDSNLTTIIATSLLYIYGTGLVKGFAITLSIGIICSMFTAITLTKLLIELWVKLFKPNAINL